VTSLRNKGTNQRLLQSTPIHSHPLPLAPSNPPPQPPPSTNQPTNPLQLRNGGVGGDVFHEASKTWHRRQAAARARVQRRAGTTAATQGFGAAGAGGAVANGIFGGLSGVFNQHVDWSPQPRGSAGGGAGGGGGAGADEDGNGGNMTKAANRIAELAAKAAQSARLWRMANAVKGPAKALTE
jgi:hypothetical protein